MGKRIFTQLVNLEERIRISRKAEHASKHVLKLKYQIFDETGMKLVKLYFTSITGRIVLIRSYYYIEKNFKSRYNIMAKPKVPFLTFTINQIL